MSVQDGYYTQSPQLLMEKQSVGEIPRGQSSHKGGGTVISETGNVSLWSSKRLEGSQFSGSPVDS